MKQENFTDDAPGDLVTTETKQGEALAYSPHPLPPEIDYDDLVTDVGQAAHALGQVEGIHGTTALGEMSAGLQQHLDAVASSKIEGVEASIADLYATSYGVSAPISRTSEREVRLTANYLDALEHGLQAVEHGEKITVDLLREIHRRLLSDEAPEHITPGELRDRQNFIGRSRSISQAQFVPPPPEQVPHLIKRLVKYINRDTDIPSSVKMGLVHYQFETIHPFADGNGRVGRILNTLLLKQEGMTGAHLLPFSTYLLRHRREYFDHLTQVSKSGSWEEWIQFILTGVAEMATQVIRGLERLNELQTEYEEQFGADARGSIARLTLRSPYLTVSAAADAVDVHYNTANRVFDELEEEGVLEEVSGRDRERLYRAPAVTKALNDVTRPTR